MIWGTSI